VSFVVENIFPKYARMITERLLKGRHKVKLLGDKDVTTLDRKKRALERIYLLHDEFAGNLETACRKKCSLCCTCNVAMTTLEGRLILDFLTTRQKNVFFRKLEKARTGKRYHPKVTINQLAEICKSGGEPPIEEIDPNWGSCPVLSDDLCPIYPVRPFGCRAMVSRKNCGTTGYADMDPFVLTVNNLLQQHIEHLDTQGFSGNFADVVQHLACVEKKGAKGTAPLCNAEEYQLIPNHPLTAPAIPPEHRYRIQPMIEALEQCVSLEISPPA
jgi:Fe-S-cluster containining protein